MSQDEVLSVLEEHKTGNSSIDDIARAIVELIVQRVKQGRAAGAKVKDVEVRKKIFELCNSLEKLIPPLLVTIQKVHDDPNDIQAQEVLAKILDKVAELSEMLAALLPKGSKFSLTDLESLLSKLVISLEEDSKKRKEM